MHPMASPSPWWTWLKLAVDVLSAVLGMSGTWLLSRRYGQPFLRNAFYAVGWPFFVLVGQGARIRDFFLSKVNANRDVPDSVIDMVLGLYLLFWAFFLQLVGIYVHAKD